MTKLPALKGKDLIAVLSKAGFEVIYDVIISFDFIYKNLYF